MHAFNESLEFVGVITNALDCRSIEFVIYGQDLKDGWQAVEFRS